MLYRLNDEFTKMDQTEGLMQNMTRYTEIEVVTCTSDPQKDSGVLLLPMEKLKFTVKSGESIYARCAKIDGTIANLSVVNFKMPVIENIGTGCNCDLIDDTEIMTEKTWSSKKIKDTFAKYYTKADIDNIVKDSSIAKYSQITKIGVNAPQTYNLPIIETETFNLPPAEVLKFKSGVKGMVKTLCEFDYTDAGSFTIGDVSGESAKFIEFDGTMHPKIEYDIRMSTPTVLGNGYISESAEINFNDYKKAELQWDDRNIDLKYNKINGSSIVSINGMNVNYGEGNGKHVISSEKIPSKAKIYIEMRLNNCNKDYRVLFGIADKEYKNGLHYYTIKTDSYLNDIYEYNNGAATVRHAPNQHVFKNGDIVALAVSVPENKVSFYVNGVLLYEVLQPSLIQYKEDLYFSIYSGTSFNWFDVTVNLGERTFAYPIPEGYTSLYKAINGTKLYLKNGEAWGIIDGVFEKVADNWATLKEDDKEGVFNSLDCGRDATATELCLLGAFKVDVYGNTDYDRICQLHAVPKDQLILSKNLLNINSFESLHKVVLSTVLSFNARCKLLVTADLNIYQTYDFQTEEWRAVDYSNLTEIAEEGIDALRLQDISSVSWGALVDGKTGLGFAYLLSATDLTDVCKVDKLELIADMKGCWKKAIHGTDYDYEYPSNDELSVNLLNSGDYKINYYKG